jgi:hypothetical protein
MFLTSQAWIVGNGMDVLAQMAMESSSWGVKRYALTVLCMNYVVVIPAAALSVMRVIIQSV